MTVEASTKVPAPPALHPGGPPATQEPDRVPLAHALAVVVVAVVVVAVSILVVVALERHPGTQWPTKPSPPVLFGVHQTPIAGPAGGPSLRAEQRRALASFSVVDRRAGIVAIPIELAKRIVVERAAGAEGRAP